MQTYEMMKTIDAGSYYLLWFSFEIGIVVRISLL